MMKNIIAKFGFQLRKNNNTRDVRVVILITTLIYVIVVMSTDENKLFSGRIIHLKGKTKC